MMPIFSISYCSLCKVSTKKLMHISANSKWALVTNSKAICLDSLQQKSNNEA